MQPLPPIAGLRWLDRDVDYSWDDDDADDIVDRESPVIQRNVERISLRGQLALATALAEWICWRLGGTEGHPDLHTFIEACWAAVADHRYLTEWTRPELEATGPVDGARLCAARLLDDVWLTGRRGRGTDDEVKHLVFLARHVTKNRKAFKDWLAEAYRRANALSPLSDASYAYLCLSNPTVEQFAALDFGAPLSRTVFDTTRAVEAIDIDTDIDAYLRGLDPAANRFLRTGEALHAAGFEGRPYRWPGV